MLSALVALAGCTGCEALTGPETDIAATLKTLEAGAALQVAGLGKLELKKLRFDRVIVKPEGQGYTAVCTVDADGLAPGPLAVSYLGLERIPFERAGGKLAPAGAVLPTLGEILAVLQARTVAFEKRDVAAYEALLATSYADPRASRAELLSRLRQDFEGARDLSLTVRGWTIRSEREQAEVLEEYDAVVGPSKEVHHGKARYVLRREGGSFRFLSGLM